MNKYDTDYKAVCKEVKRLRGRRTWEVEFGFSPTSTEASRKRVADEIEPLGADAELLECLRRSDVLDAFCGVPDAPGIVEQAEPGNDSE